MYNGSKWLFNTLIDKGSYFEKPISEKKENIQTKKLKNNII